MASMGCVRGWGAGKVHGGTYCSKYIPERGKAGVFIMSMSCKSHVVSKVVICMGTGPSTTAARHQREMGGPRGEKLRESLHARAHMHRHNDDAYSRITHTEVERQNLLIITCPVGCLGAFLQ